MTASTQALHDLGQSLWLDNISREMLDDGTIAKLIAERNVTGLTSNPTIFEKAMSEGTAYDRAIAELAHEGRPTEALFFALAIEDLQRAADLFKRVHEATGGVDGWVSLEVSPLLVNDTPGTIQAATALHAQARRENLFIKIPGTPKGIPAIEEAIYQGVPVNVTLLFSREQYLAAADAYLRGIERRVDAGKSPVVESVASVFVSRWDTAVKETVSAGSQNKLGVAMGRRCYVAYRDLLESGRWTKLAALGAHPQRLLFASTGTKDPKASPTLYVDALAAPDTIDTMPDKTLAALAEGGKGGPAIPRDGGDAEAVIADIERQGADLHAIAEKLQKDGGNSFIKSWNSLIDGLAEKVRKVAA